MLELLIYLIPLLAKDILAFFIQLLEPTNFTSHNVALESLKESVIRNYTNSLFVYSKAMSIILDYSINDIDCAKNLTYIIFVLKSFLIKLLNCFMLYKELSFVESYNHLYDTFKELVLAFKVTFTKLKVLLLDLWSTIYGLYIWYSHKLNSFIWGLVFVKYNAYILSILNLFRSAFTPQNFLSFLLFLSGFYFLMGILYKKIDSGATPTQIFLKTIFNFFVSSYGRILINTLNLCYFLSIIDYFFCRDLQDSLRTLPEWLVPFDGLLYVSNTIAIDGISFVFCFLSWHIFNKCQQLIRHKPIESQFFFQTALLITQFSIYLCFLANDLLLFFIGFELASIPMFWIITAKGSRERKKRAAVFFLLYTLLSSIFLLIPIIYFLAIFQVTDIVLLSSITNDFLTYNQKLFFATCLFIGLAIKIPLVPLHFWLTEAHVEAPTIGSVILAALVLKLGGYGMIKFLFPLFPDICKEYHVFVQIIALMSSIYAAWLALRQDDMKRIIAYSSISHMSFGLVSMFTMTNIGLLSSIGLMIGHGFIAAGLFTLAGLLYDRTETRLLVSLNGITSVMPYFGHLSLVFILANFGFPLTVNFIGEQFALMSLPQQSIGLMLISSIAIVLTVAFSLWLFNRINHGTLASTFINEKQAPVFYDLNASELRVLLSIAFYVIFFGLFPNIYFGFMRDEVNLIFFFLHK